MAGLSREEFKHLLSGRGIDRHLYATDTADVDADVVLLLSQS